MRYTFLSYGNYNRHINGIAWEGYVEIDEYDDAVASAEAVRLCKEFRDQGVRARAITIPETANLCKRFTVFTPYNTTAEERDILDTFEQCVYAEEQWKKDFQRGQWEAEERKKIVQLAFKF